MNTKAVKRLHEKKYREESGLFLVQGEKSVSELLASDFSLEHVYATHAFSETYALPPNKTTLVHEDELRSLSTLESNTAALAIARQKTDAALGEIVASLSTSPLILALDTIRDPGNFGTIIRTADWFGVTHIICSPTTVDFYNPKVISATMGSFTRMSISYFNLQEALTALKPHLDAIYGCVMDGSDVHTIEATGKPCCIVLGSESHGIGPEIEKMLTERITIPKKGHAESLNVGIAAGVVLDHFTSH
jgi:TrmH family RNA methyltransferase